MITIVYCTRKPNPEHYEHLKKTCGFYKHAQIIEIINNGISLTKCYNDGLKQAENDIVVFLHDDITIETGSWGKKLIKLYEDNPEYGILGVAGTKYMAENGRWWQRKKAMYGRVAHTHQGKSWLSAYSPDQGKRVEEVIVVDGVFFSVHKGRIKKNFDESVEGFHFYDVDFCFQNYLEGVKIGVHTNIRVNHRSIGETNDEWEKNRKIFAEKYQQHLPVQIKETFENRKLKVLMGCLNFNGLTGSEISTMETAKGLVKAGCDVTVVSNIGENYAKIAKRHGIKVASINEPPCFKLGDGIWAMQTPNGPQLSKPNVLYQVKENDFDVIHANHLPITQRLLQLYPQTPVVNIVRSEVIDLENPVIHENIKQYIAIRPSIKDYMVENFNIDPDKIKVIYNPFDHERFKPADVDSGTDKKVILFVGTLDYLREKPIQDLVLKTRDDNEELWLVGKDRQGYGATLSSENEHVKYFQETDRIEEFYHKCDVTAGIFLGRTTIEGFLCGKPAWIYKVDKHGNMIDKEYVEVPEDLTIFDTDTIIQQFKNTYIETYNI